MWKYIIVALYFITCFGIILDIILNIDTDIKK